MPGHFAESDGLPHLTVPVEERLAQLAVPESAAKPFNMYATFIMVSLRHPSHALCSNLACNTRIHFHMDESSSLFIRCFGIELQDSVSGST